MCARRVHGCRQRRGRHESLRFFPASILALLFDLCRDRLPLSQLDRNIRPSVNLRHFDHRRRRGRHVTRVDALNVLRWGQRAHSVFVPAELDDREGVQDGTRETPRPALGTERPWGSSEGVCSSGPVAFGVADRTDGL